MTYNDVLDDLFDIISKHKMIQTVGYGPLSDIKVPKDGAETNYPYAFLRPTNHTIGKNQMTYRFDLIMMEMCNDTDEEIIKAQSDCQQYIKDVLAHLYYHYDKYDFNLNNSITVFQEKYDDVVSGATIQIEFIVRDQLNDCIAPFEPEPTPPPAGDLVLELETTDNTVVYNFAGVRIDWDTVIVNNTGYPNPGVQDAEFNLQPGTYRMLLSGDINALTDTSFVISAAGYEDGNYANRLVQGAPGWTPTVLGVTTLSDQEIAVDFVWPYNDDYFVALWADGAATGEFSYENLNLKVYKTA